MSAAKQTLPTGTFAFFGGGDSMRTGTVLAQPGGSEGVCMNEICPGVLTVLDDHASPPAPSKHTYRLVVTQHRIKLVVARACVPEIIVAAGLPVGSAWVLRNQTEERLALSSESDVLEQLEGNNTGPRMLAPQSQAVLVKIEPTRWTVWGLDLS
jgi:hypothetical protein